MNKIEELIEQFCPDGVEFKELAEVAKISNGKDHKHLEEGEFPVFGSGGIMRYTNQFLYSEESVLIPRKGSIGNIFYVNKPFWTVDTIFYTRINADTIKPKFFYYYLKTLDLKEMNFAGGVPSLTKTILDKIVIPTPPLVIQQEIVSILDNFTQLEAELEAELEARRTQYEYYRNELLNFEGKEVEWKTMGEVCEMKAGKSISANDISNILSDESVFPCIGGNGKRGYVKYFSHNGSFPIIGRQGALCGNICFAEGKFYATEHAVVVAHQGRYNSRFLYYLLITMNLNQFATGGAQPGLAVSRLEKIQIPIPPLAEQERIVGILDKFDALVNDISIGLPVEIAARRQQYEYYRGKLLDFKRIGNG
jgi:type I restriction enzyme S subunit